MPRWEETFLTAKESATTATAVMVRPIASGHIGHCGLPACGEIAELSMGWDKANRSLAVEACSGQAFNHGACGQGCLAILNRTQPVIAPSHVSHSRTSGAQLTVGVITMVSDQSRPTQLQFLKRGTLRGGNGSSIAGDR